MTKRFFLKARAKQLIFTSKPSPMIAGVIITVVYILIYFFQYNGNNESLMTAHMTLIQSDAPYTYSDVINLIADNMLADKAMLALQAIFMIFNSYITFGLICYSFEITSKNGASKIQDMFPPILTYLKYILITLMIAVPTAIGLMLFIVPGIFISICYSQARFIMLDHPEMSVIKCMTESRRLMKNHFFEYFMLVLSFIGWNILASLSVLAGIWTYPYTNITMAVYYRSLCEEKEAISGDGV